MLLVLCFFCLACYDMAPNDCLFPLRSKTNMPRRRSALNLRSRLLFYIVDVNQDVNGLLIEKETALSVPCITEKI